MNKKYDKELFVFDSENQQIQKDDGVILPSELEPFVDSNGVFLCTKYCLTFMEEVHRVISEGLVPLPKGLKLTTNFHPCSVCKIEDDFPFQFVRCKHVKDCEEHAKTKADPKYKEQCQCKVYTSPCLTFSKIGKDAFKKLRFLSCDSPFIFFWKNKF